MVIDYSKEEFVAMPHFKGGEKEMQSKMFFDGKNRIMHSKLVPGASIGLHCHETSSEIMFFVAGTGKAIFNGVEERVMPDTCHYCPKGSTHTLINDGDTDLEFYAVVPEQ
ncbi:MAG: cupin domain-containing protein [Bacteroidales bacterium]|nr:cupin domain-containing protein [Bacteroidales bacterium]